MVGHVNYAIFHEMEFLKEFDNTYVLASISLFAFIKVQYVASKVLKASEFSHNYIG